MEICQVCPGEGGAFAVGMCSNCRRLCCGNHLIMRAVWGWNGLVQEVQATFPSRMTFVTLAEADRHGRSAAAFIEGWMQGENKCEKCRGEAARVALATANEQLSHQRKAADMLAAQLRVETDPTRVVQLICDGARGTREDFVRAWRILVNANSREPTHEIVDLTPQGIKGHGRPREEYRTPVWIVSGAVTRDVGSRDEPDCRIFNAYLDSKGGAWVDDVLTDGFLLPDRNEIQQFVIPHGAAVRTSHVRDAHSSNVNGRNVLSADNEAVGIIQSAIKHLSP